MVSTTRTWKTNSVLLLLLSLSVLLQLTAACPYAEADAHSQHQRRAVRPVKRQNLRFPSVRGPNSRGTPRNPACKKWYKIRDYILTNIFRGECGNAARAATRLAFHDAGTFSRLRQDRGLTNGGADGSMLSDLAEIDRPENGGLQEIVAALQPLPERFGVSSGDLLHVTGILSVITCPGGPPIETWIGRKEARNRAPTGLLPNVNDPVQNMVGRFEDMGLSKRDLIALIGAHSTARQRFVDPSQAGKSQDSTPEIWDVKFYGETLNSTTPEGVFKFASDVRFSRHPLTANEFRRFVDNQRDWDSDYAIAHEKMSLLGQDRGQMDLCTEILPARIDLGEFLGRN